MVHRDFVPNEDATVVARLKQASAMLLGKLEMAEGAYSDHHPAMAPPKNPWHAAFWTVSLRAARQLRRRPGFASACLRHWRINPLAVRRDWLVGNRAIVGTR